MIIVFPILCGASSQEQLRHIQQVKGRILISENCEWTLALLKGRLWKEFHVFGGTFKYAHFLALLRPCRLLRSFCCFAGG